MRERGLAQYGLRLNAPDGEGTGQVDSESERELRLAERRLRLEREQFELAKAKDQMLPVAEFQACLITTVGAFNAALNAMPQRAAMKIITRARNAMLVAVKERLTERQFEKLEHDFEAAQIDYEDIEEILRAEVEAMKAGLAGCEFLRPPVDTPAR